MRPCCVGSGVLSQAHAGLQRGPSIMQRFPLPCFPPDGALETTGSTQLKLRWAYACFQPQRLVSRHYHLAEMSLQLDLTLVGAQLLLPLFHTATTCAYWSRGPFLLCTGARLYLIVAGACRGKYT